MKLRYCLFVVSCICICQSVNAAIRIVDYNMAGDVRAGFSTIIEAIGNESKSQIQRPADIMLLQEQDSVSTTTQQVVNKLNTLYGAGTYSRGTLNGASTGAGRPAIVFNTKTVELLEEISVNSPSTSGAARSTIRYKVRPVGYTSDDAILYIYISHFKASDTSDDRNRRAAEAQQIRDNADALGEGVNIIYAGDLNLYDSSEEAWKTLTGSGNGQAFDPAARVGSWHNNSYYTDVHTQSPASSVQFPGQITGGMDDRFDFQLISGEMLDGEGLSFISGTYRAFGNNDTHYMNGSITTGTGASATVLSAIESTSDHIPVVADYQLPARMKVSVGSYPVWPVVHETVAVEVKIENTANVDVSAGADELDYMLSCTGDIVGSASGTIQPLAAGDTYYITLDTSTLGAKSGTITVASSSTACEPASYTAQIDYTVIDSGATIQEDFGWEIYDYKGDPAAVLAADAELSYRLVEPGYNDSNSLQIVSNETGSYSAVLAVVTGLIDDDQVDAGLRAKKLSSQLDGVCLSAEFVTDPCDVTSSNGSAGTCSVGCGTDWTQLTNSWTFDYAGGQNQAMIITAVVSEPGQIVTIDDLSVMVPMHCQIVLPQASDVSCPAMPEMDYNGDCIVDAADFAYFAENWLDGELGASQPITNPIITGIMDGTYSSRPRAIELYVKGRIDLSEYSVECSSDGGAWTDTTELSGVYENEFVYLICSNNYGAAVFDAVFGTEGDFANHALESSVISLDGNDAFRILKGSTVVDQVYGQTSAYAYQDSYMYRNDFTVPDGGWNSGDWTIPGNDTLDGLSLSGLGQAVPFGTYVTASTNCTERTNLDLNGDCQINLPDMVEFIYAWLECNYDPSWVCFE